MTYRKHRGSCYITAITDVVGLNMNRTRNTNKDVRRVQRMLEHEQREARRREQALAATNKP